jgi:hypothetical protein
VTPKPLEFGAAFHIGMETYYNPKTWHDKATAAALAQAAFVRACKEQYNAYVKLNQGNVNPEARTDYAERIELGKGMLKYYTTWISPQYDTNFKPVKVEISFEVPIRDPEGNYMYCKCGRCWHRWTSSDHGREYIRSTMEACKTCTTERDEEGWREGHWVGLPVTYGGRIDMLAEDEEGRYWVFDWKTAARMAGTPMDESPYADDEFMLLDDQITSYCWALWTLGLQVAGFVYAQIKKAVPVEPEPNKTIRLGRLYSVNRQQPTTYAMYKQTVAENDTNAYEEGLYDNFLEFLKSSEGPRFHIRHQIFRSETELRNAGFNIWQEACDMLDPKLRIYPSPGRFACNFCAFKEPCLAKNKGEDYQYTLNTLYEKRDRHYWEIKPSTDSRGGR